MLKRHELAPLLVEFLAGFAMLKKIMLQLLLHLVELQQGELSLFSRF